jgi:hypothetical protein
MAEFIYIMVVVILLAGVLGIVMYLGRTSAQATDPEPAPRRASPSPMELLSAHGLANMNPRSLEILMEAERSHQRRRDIESLMRTDHVRRECAFCHRERTPKDDNHAPECSYWDFFGPGPDNPQ